MKTKVNRVIRIGLAGGLIGALITNTRAAFEKNIQLQNSQGWNLCEVVPIGGTNLFMLIVRLLILVLTLGMFTLGSNYLLIFEKWTEQ